MKCWFYEDELSIKSEVKVKEG